MKTKDFIILALFFCLISVSYADNYKSESNGTLLYKYNPVASKVLASQVESGQNFETTVVAASFDILLDEKLDENDPRIKSIIYVAKQNTANSVMVSYTNPNAIELAGRVVSIMNRYTVPTNHPLLVTTETKDDLKLVIVKIKYIVHHKFNTSTPFESQNSKDQKNV